jgi:hypothetical protein
MKSLFLSILFVCKIFAIEAILSYPIQMQTEVMNLQKRSIDSLCLGLIKDNEQFLGKNGLFKLKIEQLDLLFISPSELQKLGLSLQDFDLYNLKLLKQTNDYYFISRLSWYNALQGNAQKALIK